MFLIFFTGRDYTWMATTCKRWSHFDIVYMCYQSSVNDHELVTSTGVNDSWWVSLLLQCLIRRTRFCLTQIVWWVILTQLKDWVILNIKNRNIWIYLVYKELVGQVSSSEDKAVLRNLCCDAVKQTLKCTKAILNTGRTAWGVQAIQNRRG